jgi:hypothetical protein
VYLLYVHFLFSVLKPFTFTSAYLPCSPVHIRFYLRPFFPFRFSFVLFLPTSVNMLIFFLSLRFIFESIFSTSTCNFILYLSFFFLPCSYSFLFLCLIIYFILHLFFLFVVSAHFTSYFLLSTHGFLLSLLLAVMSYSSGSK